MQAKTDSISKLKLNVFHRNCLYPGKPWSRPLNSMRKSGNRNEKMVFIVYFMYRPDFNFSSSTVHSDIQANQDITQNKSDSSWENFSDCTLYYSSIYLFSAQIVQIILS